MGSRFGVGPGVLIPRLETEILVSHVLQNVLPRFQHPRILDLGTGSGIVAISLALECPQATVVATDVCPTALSWAKKNARTLCGGNIDFLQGSWYDALSAQDTFDVIVSNPPYIAAADVHLAQGDLRAEPTQALTDGQDGLQFLQANIAGAPQFLRSEGALWVEQGWNQHQAVRELMLKEGFSEVRSIHDLALITRISVGTINLSESKMSEVQTFNDETVKEHPVVLFMKGTAQMPQCGFYARAVQILRAVGLKEVVTINVLDDDEVREGIKVYSDWPTIPQLYVKGEFLGEIGRAHV